MNWIQEMKGWQSQKKTLGGGQWIGFVGDLFFSGNHGYDEK
jgi:hypothetical protein